MFHPENLALARRRRGMTKRALAESIDVSDRIVSAYEAGEKVPSDSTLARIAKSLNFPLTFFEGPEFEPLDADAASFRSLARMTARQRDAAFGAGTIAISLDRWLHANFVLPEVDLPDDLTQVDPATAAESVRSAWGVGDRPIRNLVHLLERQGVRVFSLAEDSTEVDAFSLWQGDRPFVFLNTVKTAERSRFDAAHELGHLILHRDMARPRGKSEEAEANAFASSFLMPKHDVLARLTGLVDLDTIIEAKRRWRVSAMALIFRLHSLRVLSDWRYRALCVELKRAFPRSEPNPIPRERSQVVQQALGSLRTQGRGFADIAQDLHVPASELHALTFNLAMVGLDGDGSSKGNPGAKLKLVE